MRWTRYFSQSLNRSDSCDGMIDVWSGDSVGDHSIELELFWIHPCGSIREVRARRKFKREVIRVYLEPRKERLPAWKTYANHRDGSKWASRFLAINIPLFSSPPRLVWRASSSTQRSLQSSPEVRSTVLQLFSSCLLRMPLLLRWDLHMGSAERGREFARKIDYRWVLPPRSDHPASLDRRQETQLQSASTSKRLSKRACIRMKELLLCVCVPVPTVNEHRREAPLVDNEHRRARWIVVEVSE